MASLTDLGWTAFFSNQIKESAEAYPSPARVVADQGARFMLSAGLEPFAAMWTEKLRPAVGSEGRPVVGDWVLWEPERGGTARIVKRLERFSRLARRRPQDRNALGCSTQEQVLAANVDKVFLVTSLNQDLNPARLERALVMIWDSGATPVILLSKTDLIPDWETHVDRNRSAFPGVDLVAVSAVSGLGLDTVRSLLPPGSTACLLGSSGVGKTTLINQLTGSDRLTLDIRTDDDRGRHATTARDLIPIPGAGLLIDTPGLREFGLSGGADSVDLVFDDIASLAPGCRFRDCRHEREPGCAVRREVEEGRLNPERLERYLKLRQEADFQENKNDPARMLEEKRKQKQLGRLIKDVEKRRRERYQG